MGLSKTILNETDRAKLDGIVDQMISNNEPEENIRFVVDDFKSRYSVKKKDSPSLSQLSGTGEDGLSAFALDVTPEQETIFQEQKKKYEGSSGVTIDGNDPVGSAKKSIIRTVKKPRITSASGISSTGVKRPMEAALTPIEPEEKGVSFTEASKDLKAVENYYRYNTDRSVSTLSKATGLNKDQLYSDAYDDQIKQSIQPGNTTQALAYEALQDAKKANRVIQGGGTIEDMAIRLAGENDPMIKKQIEGQSDVYALGGDMFGKGTKGRLMADMFNNPAFQQEIKNNPALAQEFKQESANLAKNYPEFGKAHYGQIVSQKMEDMGINNGILNVVTKDEFDSVVQKLKEEGKITLAEEAFINENLRSDTGLKGLGKQIIGRENISTPGLVENTLQGGFTGLENLGKGVAEITGARDIIQGEEQALKTDVERANTNVDVKTKGWHEVTQQGGKFLGQSLGIGGGGGLIKALKIAKNPAVALGLSGGIQAYANYAPEARMLFPGELLKQRGYATVMSGIEALTENIFRDDKVIKGLLKEFKPLVRETIQDFTVKKISASAAESTLESGIKKIVTSFSKASGQNVAEEFAAGALGQITQGVFQGKPMSEWIDAEDLAETVKMAAIGSPFIAALATRADFMKNRGITSKQVYMMARDPEYYASQMQEMAKLDEDLAAQLPDKLENLQYATELLNELDSQEGLTEKQKAKFLLTSLDSKIKEQSQSTKTDPILKAKENAESFMAIQENDKVKQDILEGKDDGTYEGDTSDEMSKEEIAAAKILAKANLPGIYAEMAEENPVGVLQEIAQQAQGIDSEGKELEGGDRRQDLIDSGVPEKVIDEAAKLYPKQVTPMQDQSGGAAENVVPSTLEDIYLMSSDELGELQKSTKGEQKQKLIDAVGKDWYDKYSMATNEEKSKMEDSLTDEQKKVFGGVGVSDSSNPEVIRDLRQKIAAIEAIEDKEVLGSRVRQAVTDLANDRNNKESIAILNAAGKRVNELGFSKKEIQDAAIADLRERVGDENAKSILDTYFTKNEATKETAQVPNTPEATGAATGTPNQTGGTSKKSVLERPIEEVSIDDILKELAGDEGLAFKDVSNKDIKGGDTKDIEAYNQRAERVLNTLYPNAEFKAFNTTKEYEKETGRKGEAGVLIRGKDGKHKLFLNLEAIRNSDIERTATHEVVHALVSDAIGAKHADLRKKWESLLPKLYKVKGFEIVKEHVEKYSSADRPVEGITDLLANIVHNKIKIEDIPKNLWDEFIDLINKAFEAMGVDYKITPDTFNGFAQSVKEAFETGDFTNLKKFTSKSKTEKFFKEHPEFAETASAMVDPEKRKQLEELLKTKIQQELNQGKVSQDQANEFYKRAGIEPPIGEPPVAEGADEESELPERQFTKQMIRSDELSEKSKGEISKTLNYVRQTNEMSIKEANEIIDYVGLEEAQNVVMNDSGIKPVVRVVLGQIIIKKYNELADKATSQADKDYYLDRTIQTATFVTEKLATEAGQQIQAFSLWSRLSPEGQLRAANQDMERQGKEKLRRRQKDINKIGDKFQKANEEAADEVTQSEEVKQAVKKEESDRTTKAKDKIQKAKEKRARIIKKRKDDKGKGGNLFSSPLGLTPEGIEFVGDIAKTYLDEGIANLEILVDKIIKHLEDVAGKKVTDEVKKKTEEIADKELAKYDKKLLGEGFKPDKLSKLVKQHYIVVEKTKRSLTQKLMDEMDMSQSNASALAKKVEDAFDRIATRKKRNILYNEKARFDKINNTLKGAKKPEQKTVADDVIKYSNLGAFENSELSDMLAEKFGIGQISTDQAAKLKELADKIQKAPEGSPKRDATEDLLAYRAKLRGNDLMETVQAVWYANILSGYKTHEKNVVSTFFNTMFEIGAEMTKDPKAIPYLTAGYLNGVFRRGLVEAGHTLSTGRSPIHIKKIETPSTLERKNFIGGAINPGNWFKYVSRLMVAEDVLSFQGLKEARARQLARREAQSAGYNTWTKKGWDKVNEILFHTKERMSEAKLQAEEEGLKGIQAKRRVYELMEESRPIKMTEDAYGFAAHGTFNHESEGSLGALTNAVAQALDSVNVGGAKPLRFIVPFTRIITNVVNNSLDYTPAGFIRAARGVRGFRSFEDHQFTKGAFKELTNEERQRLVAKASIGIALAATLQALHVAGVISISGGGPEDEKKKRQLMESGWQEYSIKVGNKWYSYKYTPLIFLTGFLGNMNDAKEYATTEDEGTMIKRIELASFRIGGQVADMTWINSASTFLGGLTEKNTEQKERKLTGAFANMGKGFIPFRGSVEQTTQLYNNIANMPQKQVNNAWQAMISSIPIARNSLNDKINALGDPIIGDIDVLVSKETKDPVWKFLLDHKGWVAPVNRNTLIVIDKGTQLERPVTPDEYYEFSKKRGQKIRAEIEKLIDADVRAIRKNDWYDDKVILAKDMNEAQLNKVLTKIERQATVDTKEELFGEED